MQVQAEDESGQVSMQFDERFQQGVDAISMFDGSGGTDDYLMAWEWGEYSESEGTPREAAEAVAKRYNAGFPTDFVSRIRKLHVSGERDPRPGALDGWLD